MDLESSEEAIGTTAFGGGASVTPLVDGYHIEEAGKLRLGLCRVYHPTAALVKNYHKRTLSLA